MLYRSLLLIAVICFSSGIQSVHGHQDHYSALGVARSASEDEIKKAFKKLARKLHPDAQRDLNPDQKEAARKRFMAISDAYEVLGDKKKREAYDNYGGRSGGSGDERMFLRNNLFAHDYDGDQIDAAEAEKYLRGNVEQGMLLFLWSSNVPDCIDPGLDYKKVAQRLVGSSVRVAAMRCDDMNYQMCRFSLQVPNLPSLVLIPGRNRNNHVEYFKGKFEYQAMTEFGAKFLKEHTTRVRTIDMTPMMERCPDPSKSPLFEGHAWMAPYFAETMKRSVAGEWQVDFVALEFSPCFDCNTELNIAVETLAPVMPGLVVHKVHCDYQRNKKWCLEIAGKQQDRAWTIVRIQQRCFYATKKPFAFSDEHCEAPQVTAFDGKYSSGDFVQFLLAGHASHILPLRGLAAVKQANDSYAVLFVDSKPRSQSEWLAAAPAHRHWEILARQVNTFRPVTGAKGFKLRIAMIDCSAKNLVGNPCDEVRGRGKPVVALYPFGVKAKQQQPFFFDRIASSGSALLSIQRDMEPLHLHVLNQHSWKSKVTESMEKGRKWIIMFNAGQWCPPCNHIRPNWKETARMIQNSPASNRLSVGVVECDEHRPLCDQQNIQNYPTIYFYSKGRDRMMYNGNREAPAMSSWAIDAMDSRLQRIDFREIQTILQRGGTIMVSFTAGQWCPPCMQLSPIYKQVANRLATISVSETNCDDEQWVCNQFGIQGYPTIVLFHKGARHEFQGNKNTDGIVQWAQNLVKG